MFLIPTSEREVVSVAVRIVVPMPVYRLKKVIINWDLTPKQAVGLLSGSNPDIALWPEGGDQMGLWNGGKTGVEEGMTLPIYWDRRSFSTAEGRQKQAASGIGFAWPVVIASLALPENEPERVRKELNEDKEIGMWALVALRQRDEELWLHDGSFRPFCLCLSPYGFGFHLGYAGLDWLDSNALVGAPQVP